MNTLPGDEKAVQAVTDALTRTEVFQAARRVLVARSEAWSAFRELERVTCQPSGTEWSDRHSDRVSEFIDDYCCSDPDDSLVEMLERLATTGRATA